MRPVRYIAYAAGIVAGVVVLMAPSSERVIAQAANSIYVTPSAGSYPAGSSLTVEIRENTSSLVNAVQADMRYSDNLQFVGIDAAGTAFGIDASSTGSGGLVSIARGTIEPVRGDQLVAKVSFKVLATGAATLKLEDSSIVLSSETNTNVITVRNSAAFNGASMPPSTATPTPTPASNSPNPAPASAGGLPVTRITPAGSSNASTPLPGDSYVELTAPVELTTSPDAGREVTKVEYLLNDQLIATTTTAPYGHKIQTDDYRNGTYTLTTKTYYADGSVDTSTASVAIKNPFGIKQLWLQLRHYAWLVILVLIILGELIYLLVRRARKRQGKSVLPGTVRPGGVVRPGTIPSDPFTPPTDSSQKPPRN